MIPSPSSSKSVSAFFTILSISFLSVSDNLSIAVDFSSLSSNFTAYHLLYSETPALETISSRPLITPSTLGSNTSIKECFPFFATSSEVSITLSIFLFLNAEISIIGQFNISLNFPVSILSPFFSTTSIIFNATTIGIPISDS